MNKRELFERWIEILRRKAEYEHDQRKSGQVVTQPDLDDVCNEMEAFITGLGE